jgi:hypothetical protein
VASRAESPAFVWLTRDDALAAALPAPIRKLIRSFDAALKARKRCRP